MTEQTNSGPLGALRDGALLGKTMVVTGGGTGLGRSMATYFLQLGARVVIASRKKSELAKAADELMAETGGEVLPVSCDVRDGEQVANLLVQAEERFGEIHGLINNAAGNFISPTERLSSNAFSTIIDIVLKGTVNCTLAFGKHWIAKRQPASIVNIVTTYAFTGSGFVAPSAAAKGGVLALTRSLAAEWGKYNIRSNAIAPGAFPTKGAWDRLLPGDLAQQVDVKSRIPLKRVGNHQELANLAAFLVSDFAGFINGEVITIDGGEWVQGAGQFNRLEGMPASLWDNLEQQTRAVRGSE